ncbi:hypothetical protein [Streptomyces sp. NBC_01334]|nr:hypothetical protein OG736_46830 [Streptomyces sp. NBC_01334]
MSVPSRHAAQEQHLTRRRPTAKVLGLDVFDLAVLGALVSLAMQ